jgi:hypothetical protein
MHILLVIIFSGIIWSLDMLFVWGILQVLLQEMLPFFHPVYFRVDISFWEEPGKGGLVRGIHKVDVINGVKFEI